MDSAHGTLVADTVSTEDFTVGNADVVVHLRSGSGPIYFTVNGTDPEVEGAGTYLVHNMLAVRSVAIDTSDAQTIKLISASADSYSVEVI